MRPITVAHSDGQRVGDVRGREHLRRRAHPGRAPALQELLPDERLRQLRRRADVHRGGPALHGARAGRGLHDHQRAQVRHAQDHDAQAVPRDLPLPGVIVPIVSVGCL